MIIGSGKDPRVRRVELNGTNVVQMPEESEEATPELVIPAFNLVIVSAARY